MDISCKSKFDYSRLLVVMRIANGHGDMLTNMQIARSASYIAAMSMAAGTDYSYRHVGYRQSRKRSTTNTIVGREEFHIRWEYGEQVNR